MCQYTMYLLLNEGCMFVLPSCTADYVQQTPLGTGGTQPMISVISIGLALPLIIVIITAIAVFVAVRRKRLRACMKQKSRIEPPNSDMRNPLPLHFTAASETTNKVQNSKDPRTDRQGACASECIQSTCFWESNKQDKHSEDPLVLVIYSPNSPEKDKRVVMEQLVRNLARHCTTECYDSSRSSLRQNVSAWLENISEKASVILCVCDAQFKKEWCSGSFTERPTAPEWTGVSLVFSLGQLAYATLSKNIPLSRKFAVVLLRQSDQQHIPEYLSGTKLFLVDQVEEIARFVHEIPKCVKPEH